MPGKQDSIHRQFDLLEQKKKALFSKIASLSSQQYLASPSTGGWSVAQAANHVYLSEQLSLAYIRKKLSYPDTIPKYSPTSWAAVLLLKFALWSPYKAKAPKAINMWEQQAILSVDDLDHNWSALRKELITFIEHHQADFGRHLVYRHPYAGRLTMHQMLIFFNDHMAHHLKQIERIMRAEVQP
jgi:hypothetical protein